MSMVDAKKTLIMKLETTSGTAETVANADFDLRFFEIEADPEIDYWVNEFASGRHSKATAALGKKKCSLSAKHALYAGSAAGTAPKLGKAFKSCGQTETIVASTSVAYTPDAAKDEGNLVTATFKLIYVPTSGSALILTVKGAMGNCLLSLDDLGQPLVAQFNWLGAFADITDGAVLTLTSPDTGAPNAVIGNVTSVAAETQRIGKMSLDFGNSVQLDYNGGDSTGFAAAYIEKRDPKWMMDPKKVLIATSAHYTRWAAGTEAALSMTTAAVAGLKATITAPKGQVMSMKDANRNGMLTYDQTYELHENAGNDAHQILLSA